MATSSFSTCRYGMRLIFERSFWSCTITLQKEKSHEKRRRSERKRNTKTKIKDIKIQLENKTSLLHYNLNMFSFYGLQASMVNWFCVLSTYTLFLLHLILDSRMFVCSTNSIQFTWFLFFPFNQHFYSVHSYVDIVLLYVYMAMLSLGVSLSLSLHNYIFAFVACDWLLCHLNEWSWVMMIVLYQQNFYIQCLLSLYGKI